jgi:hypothetical protein
MDQPPVTPRNPFAPPSALVADPTTTAPGEMPPQVRTAVRLLFACFLLALLRLLFVSASGHALLKTFINIGVYAVTVFLLARRVSWVRWAFCVYLLIVIGMNVWAIARLPNQFLWLMLPFEALGDLLPIFAVALLCFGRDAQWFSRAGGQSHHPS